MGDRWWRRSSTAAGLCLCWRRSMKSWAGRGPSIESAIRGLWSSAATCVKSVPGSTGGSTISNPSMSSSRKRFPGSRRKAYYLMTIHEQLPRIPKLHLKQVGWSKATELVKVARRDGQQFDCATWLHRAQQLPKEEFKHEVEKHLTGKETEPWEILYFKVYKSQLAVIEQALETAALMLGTDKSRGYCLEMICADFLAGANLENNNPKALLFSLNRLIEFLPRAQKVEFLEQMRTAS